MITKKQIEELAKKEARLQFHPQYSKDEYYACLVCFREGFNQAVELIEPRWILTSEKLPEIGIPVLVYLPEYGTPNVIPMWIEELSGMWFSTSWSFKRIEEASHWMPLPEPPKS